MPTQWIGADTDAVAGTVRWRPLKSLWLTAAWTASILGCWQTLAPDTILVFLISSAVTLCLGHSLGMHRRLIHRSYDCPRWLELAFVHLGVLVGIAGPIGMLRAHDTRDWAQRQPRCHAYFAHREPFLKDGFWQLHCDVELLHPPLFRLPTEIADDRALAWMERTWMLQQLPLALLLFAIGGWPWVLWGSCLRVAVSSTGHWLIGYFAHNGGPRHWHVSGSGVQGYNVPAAALLTFGECWHNNHHAFPGSARLGLAPGEWDPGWWVLAGLRRIGLVRNVRTAADLPPRPELVTLG